MDIELGFLSAVLEGGDIKPAINKKITTNFFLSKSKPVWQFIRSHYHEFKVVPSLEAVKRKFPEFETAETKEPVEYFIQELQDRQRYNLILDGMKKISEGLSAKESD